METRSIGSLQVSVIGLGTNNFGFLMDEPDVAPVFHAALDAGINFIDTADSYATSEERIGRLIGPVRDDIVLATKFASPVDGGTGGATPEYIRSAVERSLRLLQTDRIDLYQIHRPDPDTPIADTLAALDELVRAGKVVEIGCSNFSAAQLAEAEAAAADGAARFVSVQNHYNLLHRDDEAEVIPTAERLGIGYVPYYPLASGLLTGKYRSGEAAPEGTRLAKQGERGEQALANADFDKVATLTAWAAERGHSLLELAFAWLLAKPAVASVIAGATKVSQVQSNASVTWQLTLEEVAELDAITSGG
ncbi:MAG TPA: aldo/keto reductase [Ilumatobacter sp.]|nr:aldo/keto reductase [Ilumatobacter sp.]